MFRSKALDGPERQEAMELIRSLVETVVLVPEDGGLKVEIRGALAGILRLAADSKAPGAGAGRGVEGLAEQIKMVAGTGFDLYRARFNV